jgi:hypothetical protein
MKKPSLPLIGKKLGKIIKIRQKIRYKGPYMSCKKGNGVLVSLIKVGLIN